MAGTMEGMIGLNTVLRNLAQESKAIEGRTLKGLIRGAIIIKRDMLQTPPTVPWKTGNLVGSFFIVTSKGSVQQGMPSEGLDVALAEVVTFDGPAVTLGFGAEYAVFVHEMVGANFTKEGSGAKFMISSLNNTRQKVLAVIREEARIK